MNNYIFTEKSQRHETGAEDDGEMYDDTRAEVEVCLLLHVLIK